MKYFFHNKTLQLDILYAVQYFNHRIQHSPNLINRIFNLIYEEGVIRDYDIFEKWRDEEYEEGHDVTVQSVKDFLSRIFDDTIKAEKSKRNIKGYYNNVENENNKDNKKTKKKIETIPIEDFNQNLKVILI